MKFAAIILAVLLYGPVPGIGQEHQPPNAVSTGDQNSSTYHQSQTNSPLASQQPNSIENYAAEEAKAALSQAASNRTIVEITFALFVVAIVQACVYGIQCWMMNKAIDQGRRSSEAQLRAYIALGRIQAHLPNAEHISVPEHAVSLSFKNTGQTPAYNVVSHVFWDSFSGDNAHLPEGYKFPGLETVDPNQMDRVGSNLTLGNGEERPSAHGLVANPKGVKFDDVYKKFFRDDEVTIFIFAQIAYDDIFKKERRTTRGCMRIVKEDTAIRLLAYDMFNDAT